MWQMGQQKCEVLLTVDEGEEIADDFDAHLAQIVEDIILLAGEVLALFLRLVVIALLLFDGLLYLIVLDE